MLKIIVGLLAALAAMRLDAAAAQGVFDLAPLANTLSAGANRQAEEQRAGRPPAPLPPEVAASLRYRPSPDVRKQNVANFVAGLRAVNADAAAQMEQGLAQVDVIEEVGKALAPYGLHTDDVADAYAIYVLQAWMTAHGRTDDNTPAQVAGVQRLAQAAMAGSPNLLKLGDADKQKLAEGLILQAALFDMMLQGTASDPAAQAKVQADVRGAAKEMGLDVDRFELTADGLARKP